MNDTPKQVNFLSLIPKPANGHRPPQPVKYSPDLPVCALCAAPALADRVWSVWCDLTHDCNCALERPAQYLNGLRRLWQAHMALPHFMENLPARYHAYTLERVERTQGNAKALSVANFSLDRNLYLYGEAGTGKTMLAVATARMLAAEGRSARFWHMVDLFEALRDASGGRAPRPELDHWDVLVLDDIDKLKATDYVYETLYKVVNSRWANGKVTILTAQTNPNEAALILTPNGSERAADPLASRFGEGHVFKVTGTDRRAG